MNEPTDHESILLLTKAVEGLGKRLDEKLSELKTDIRELKDNYAFRLSSAEQQLINFDKVKVAKDEQDVINKKFSNRIDVLEKWKIYLIGLGCLSGSVFGTLAYLLINHLLGK